MAGRDPREPQDTYYLHRDVQTLAARAGTMASWVVYHGESGVCYSSSGTLVDDRRARHFKGLFDSLKPSTPSMEILVVGKSRPSRKTVLNKWPMHSTHKAPISPGDVSEGLYQGPVQGPDVPFKHERACKGCGQMIRMIMLQSGNAMPVDSRLYSGGHNSPPLITADGRKLDQPTENQTGYLPHSCGRAQQNSEEL